MERLSDILDWIVTRILMVVTGVEAVVVISAVIARYVFNSSFPWSEEVGRALLTWMIFLGVSAAIRRDQLVMLVFFRELLSDHWCRIVRLATLAVSAVFFAYAGYYTVRLMELTFRQTLPVTGVRIAWIYAAIPVGAAISILHLTNHFIALAQGRAPIRDRYVSEEGA